MISIHAARISIHAASQASIALAHYQVCEDPLARLSRPDGVGTVAGRDPT
jgi:hypothetical protein